MNLGNYNFIRQRISELNSASAVADEFDFVSSADRKAPAQPQRGGVWGEAGRASETALTGVSKPNDEQ